MKKDVRRKREGRWDDRLIEREIQNEKEKLMREGLVKEGKMEQGGYCNN